MGMIALPQRHLVQPQYPAPFADTHRPVACVLGSVSSELIGRKLRTESDLLSDARPCGKVRVAVDRDSSDTHPVRIPALSDFTLYAYVSFASSSMPFQYILGLSAPGDNYLGIPARHDDSLGGHWGLLLGASGVITFLDSTEFLPQNTLTAIVITRAGSSIKFFRDGILKNTVTNSTTIPALESLTLNSYTFNGSNGCAGNTYFAIVGLESKTWTDGEIRSFAGNPFRVFKAPPRRIWTASTPVTTHDLVGANATQSNAAGTDSISQAHALTGSASAQANASATGAISQGLSLVADNAAQANTAATGAVTQTHALTGSASAQSNAASTGAISQGAQFAADPVTQANAASAGAITQAHALAGTGSTQPNAASAASITQTHALTGAGSTQANTAAQGAISQGVVHDLAAAASTQTNTATTGAITQAHVLVSAPSIQDNIAAASAIVQAHVLAALPATQGNSASSGAITAGDNVLVSIVERTATFRRSRSVTVRFN